MRKVTITLTDATDEAEGALTIGIDPPVDTLSDLATVLLMVGRANAEIINSTVTALDTISEIDANRALRRKK